MTGKMAKIYSLIIASGFMIVIIAFGIGYVNSQNTAVYFSTP